MKPQFSFRHNCDNRRKCGRFHSELTEDAHIVAGHDWVTIVTANVSAWWLVAHPGEHAIPVVFGPEVEDATWEHHRS